MPLTSTPSDPRGPAPSAVPEGSSSDGLPIGVGRTYLRAMRTHWPFAVLFVAAVLAASVILLSRRSPTYEATAELLVSPVEPTDTSFAGLSVVQELGDPTRTIQTAAALVENRQIADVAADRLGDPWTGAAVEDAITVTPQGQTNVLEVRASTDDGSEAAEVANVYAQAVLDVRHFVLRTDVDEAMVRLQDELATLGPEATPPREALEQRAAELRLLRVAGDPTVSFAESAGVPSASTGVSSGLVLAIALGAALLLAPGAALLVERVGPRRVRSGGDLADALAAPVLATLPEDRRPGPWPVPTGDGAERAGYGSLATRFEVAQPPPHSIMVVSPSRGDGRTSVVTNLVGALARSGAKVAAADLDAVKPDLTAALTSGPFTVLRLDPDRVDSEPESYASPSELVRDASQSYDYVLIDTPPLLHADHLVRLTAEVDAVVVVARRDHTLQPGLEAVHELLMTVGATPTGGVLLGAPQWARISWPPWRRGDAPAGEAADPATSDRGVTDRPEVASKD
jgi:Mrp family chromosome partitioning ATPase